MGEELGQVECHSGFRYGERPLAFYWQGERLEVKEIQAGWRSPQGPCFRVLSHSEQIFELVYLEDQDHWLIRSL
jgi:hypothetical protein